MKRALPYLMLAVALAGVAAFFGWALKEGEHLGGGWESLEPIIGYVIGGLLAVGALTAGLIWLAFYSSRHGYDEPFDVNEPRGGPTGGGAGWQDQARRED